MVSADTSKVDIANRSKYEDSKFEEIEKGIEQFSKMRINDKKNKLPSPIANNKKQQNVSKNTIMNVTSFMENSDEDEEEKDNQKYYYKKN